MSKKILVTGASGFVGTYLVRELLNNSNHQIYAAVYGSGSSLSELIPADHIYSGDLSDYNFAADLIQKVAPDIVYQLAALSVVHNSEAKAGQVLSANITIQYNILESVRQFAPHARVIAICSANEYGLVQENEMPISESAELRPLNPYAVSKVAQDMLAYQYFLAYGLDVVRLRPFNHTGPGQTTDFIIPALAEQFASIKKTQKEPVITVGNTESIRDFTDVRDMVKAYVLAADKCKSGEVYNIGYGKGSSVSEIISMFESVSGLQVKLTTQESQVRGADVPVLIADSSRFRSVTGWQPEIPFMETIKSVYNYYLDK